MARKAFEASLIISALATSVRTIGASERRVQRGDAVGELARVLVGPDHHAVGLHEVRDRRALLEELGVRHVAGARAAALDRAAGAHRHGALHHQRVLARVAQLVEHASPRARGRRRPSRWAACRRSTNSSCALLEHLGHVGGEVQALGVLRDQLGQAGLVDRHLAARERLDLLGQDVARPDLVAELGEAGGGDQADPADADDADRFLLVMRRRGCRGTATEPRTERAIASICFSASVSSSVLEIQ